MGPIRFARLSWFRLVRICHTGSIGVYSNIISAFSKHLSVVLYIGTLALFNVHVTRTLSLDIRALSAYSLPLVLF